MAKHPNAVFSLPIAVERTSNLPLYRQIYDAIREAILDGRLRRGLRLPSTRLLAQELGVSRNIVVLAFEQLLAEGYLEARTGAGTSVAKTMPEELLHVGRRSTQERPSPKRKPLSRRLRCHSPILWEPSARCSAPTLNTAPSATRGSTSASPTTKGS